MENDDKEVKFAPPLPVPCATDLDGVPTATELERMHRNLPPASSDVEVLLDDVTRRCSTLACWAEANIPHGPELRAALAPMGILDQLRGALKAAVARRHPDQA